jgi:RES domain
VLPARTQLWRVHGKHRSCTEFKAVTADRYFGGSRFDSTPDDPYPYLYAARDQQTALLESLVRGIPFNDKGERLIRRVAVSDLRISALVTTADLTLISLLTTADLAAACQDEWLVQTPASEYPQTRRWAQWLRAQAPWAQGLVWPSVRDVGGRALVLFGDRCGADALQALPGAGVNLDDVAGAEWLNQRLAPYRISIRPAQRAS